MLLKEINIMTHSFLGHIQMKLKIDYIKDKRIVHAKTSGRMSRQDRRKLSEEVLAAGRKKNVNEFLLNQKETEFGLSAPEINRLPVLLRDTGFGPTDRMAILIKPGSLKSVLRSFLQDVLSLSSPRVQVFTDTGEAIAWLKVRN
jgi:hypothetical protein